MKLKSKDQVNSIFLQNWTEIQNLAYAFNVLPAFITEQQKVQHAIEVN